MILESISLLMGRYKDHGEEPIKISMDSVISAAKIF